MKIFDWWNRPATINQSIAKGLVSGVLIGSVLFALITLAFDHLIEQSPSAVCRKTEVFGSSAWVACVDRVIAERVNKGARP